MHHPKIEERIIWVQGFYCGGCGKWRTGVPWYTPTDEQGEKLYHPWCAPQGDFTYLSIDDRRHAMSKPAWLWCRSGQHVAAATDGRQGNREPCDHRQPETDRTRVCEQCGESFTPSRSDARYCSGRCRVAAHRQGLG
jgi:hypothetical protein